MCFIKICIEKERGDNIKSECKNKIAENDKLVADAIEQKDKASRRALSDSIAATKAQNQYNELYLSLKEKDTEISALKEQLKAIEDETLNRAIEEENRKQDEFEQAKIRVLKNYRKKELERQALLELIEQGVIFNDDDPDLKYLQQLKRKYKLDF